MDFSGFDGHSYRKYKCIEFTSTSGCPWRQWERCVKSHRITELTTLLNRPCVCAFRPNCQSHRKRESQHSLSSCRTRRTRLRCRLRPVLDAC